MPNNETLQAHVIAGFLMTARHHFGLSSVAPSNIRLPTPLSRLRPMLRSLLVVGSLGTVMTPPTFAAEPVFPVNECKGSEGSSKREAGTLKMPALQAGAEKPSEH